MKYDYDCENPDHAPIELEYPVGTAPDTVAWFDQNGDACKLTRVPTWGTVAVHPRGTGNGRQWIKTPKRNPL